MEDEEFLLLDDDGESESSIPEKKRSLINYQILILKILSQVYQRQLKRSSTKLKSLMN